MAAVSDVYRVGLACWLNGQLGLNVRHYRVSSIGGLGVDDVVIANAVMAHFQPDYCACMTADAFFLGVSVRNLTLVPAAAAVISTLPEEPGAVAGAELPTQVAGLITLRSALAGRANRGRAYIAFPCDADNDGDARPTNAYMIALTALAATFIASITATAGNDNNVLVPVVGEEPPTDNLLITAAIGRRAWATQRRRGSLGAANPRTVPFV